LIDTSAKLYLRILDQPTEECPENQDGARKLLELITYRFLSQVDLSLWQTEPESFILHEDEQFSEQDL
jgi:DNA polymerase IIIc chi subunit